MASFGPKPWVNPFGKMSIFLTFITFCFSTLEIRFLLLEYHKTHFPGIYCLKKRLEKWPFLDQKRGITPLEKCQFFDFLNFLFLWPKKAFSVPEYHKRNFPGTYYPKKKVGKWPFLDQNHGLTPLEKCQFFDFLNFLFL